MVAKRSLSAVVAVVAGVIVLTLVLGGCRKDDAQLSLPETPVLSGNNRFVLVVDTYARIHGTPSRDSLIKTQTRRGDILTVKSRTPDEIWVEVRQLPVEGWILRESVRLFPSREQALNARHLLDK
jgi:hypothetical protein